MSKETYTFLATVWDVEKAHEMVAAGDIITEGPVAIDDAASLLGLHRVNEEYADKLTDKDLERPIILARQNTNEEKPEPFTMLIDGWHRVWKAKQRGFKHLPAVMVDGEQIILQGLGR